MNQIGCSDALRQHDPKPVVFIERRDIEFALMNGRLSPAPKILWHRGTRCHTKGEIRLRINKSFKIAGAVPGKGL